MNPRLIIAILATLLISFTLNGYFNIYHYAPEIDIRGNKNLVRSPAVEECPAGWIRSEGKEPETGMQFVSCTDSRYIITNREGGHPVGFDTRTGLFLTDAEIAALPR